jgi:MFS superfamily sulfate permease-like transporter
VILLGLPWWAWIYLATIPCVLIALVVGLCAAAARGDEQIERNARELPPRFPHPQMRSHRREPLVHARRGWER